MFAVLAILSGRTCAECIEIIFFLNEGDPVRFRGRPLDKKLDFFHTLSTQLILKNGPVRCDSEHFFLGVFGRNIYGLFH